MFVLPNDLNKAIEDMEKSVVNSLESDNSRLIIEFKFEGIKFNRISFKLFNLLANNNSVYLTYSDPGAVALAQRDYKEIKDKIFTYSSFTKSPHISESNSILISMLPQPYDFDTFEPMCEKFIGKHISINPKFEDANIGIGQVIRDRRKNFNVSWKNIYSLEPLSKGALMHKYPDKWELYTQENNLYKFKKDFDSKPDNETIYVYL